MPPKELSRHQLSSKLSYSQSTPSFLLKFKNRMAGMPDDEEEEDFDHEYEDDGSGRPPIPRRPRPAIPERPTGDPGSADEEDGDEKPQVVVLKEGKHLTEREAENVRRKEKGLPPLPDPTNAIPETEESVGPDKNKHKTQSSGASLSFSSSKSGFKSTVKRKVVEEPERGAVDGSVKKKAKKTRKALLSFSDDP